MLAIQWLDDKVVGCISTLEETRLVSVQQRKGNKLLQLSMETALKNYEDGMGSVNGGDQYHEMGAVFASKSHHKKWYKWIFLSICDFMILNSFLHGT